MATPTSNSVPASDVGFPLDAHTASLIAGVKWGGAVGTGVTLTYSFPEGNDTAYDPDSYPPGNPFLNEWIFGDGWTPLNGTQQANFVDALEAWANVADIVFAPLEDNGTEVGEIRVAFSELVDAQGAGAWAYLPDDFPYAGDIWLSHLDIPESLDEGSWQFNTIIHELGHALGLKHPFDTDGSEVVLSAEFDNLFYTVMTYTDDPSGNGYFIDRYPTTPMVIDIQSIQYLYGVNDTYHTGDDTYTYNGNELYFETIWDAGGTDTIVHDGSNGTVIDLRPGAWSGLGLPIEFSHFNGSLAYTDPRTVWIAFGTDIENAIGGSGDDEIYGNDLGNALYGGDGDDLLNGGGGNDLLYGEAGDDLLAGGADNDTLNGGDGTDTASYVDAAGGITVNLAAAGVQDTNGAGFDTLLDIEHLVGSAHADVLTGDSGGNVLAGGGSDDDLYGGAGNDLLIGGDGIDHLFGGAGIDTADYRDMPAYVVVELSENAVQIYGSVVLETLFDVENVRGTQFEDFLLGDTGDNLLAGYGGDDFLLGFGGSDELIGGDGQDHLRGGADNDIFNGGDGNDTVDFIGASAGVSVDLANDAIQDTGGAGFDVFIGIENLHTTPYDDVVYGNSAANFVLAGAGNDLLVGLGGADDLRGDQGDDLIYGGAGDDDLIGGSGNDVLYGGNGNDGFDTITVDGETGTDIHVGGSGNDSYVIQSGDTVIELANEGTDTILANFSLTLPDHVENFSASSSGANLVVSGNALDNTMHGSGTGDTFYGLAGRDLLFGGSGDDVLYGGGGNDILEGRQGADVLWGGAGDDHLSELNSGANETDVDVYRGGTGDDEYQISPGDIIIENPGEGMDSVLANFGLTLFDNVEGLSVSGWSGMTEVFGNASDNFIYAYVGASVVHGMDGDDHIRYFGNADAHLYGDSGADDLWGTFRNDHLWGGLDGDYLNGWDGDDILYGGEGNDVLSGWAGADRIYGGDGEDFLEGDYGDDRLYGGAGDDYYNCGAGNDVVVMDADDASLVFGGSGNDVLVLSGAVTFYDMTDISSLNIHSMETLRMAGAQTLHVDAQSIVNNAFDVDPAPAKIFVLGGAGNEVSADDMWAYAGSVTLDGIDFDAWSSGAATLYLQTGLLFTADIDEFNEDDPGEQDDVPVIEDGTGDSDLLQGSTFDDRLRGLGGDDILHGGAGDDVLLGNAGNDSISGAAGDDTLKGGGGDDIIKGLEGDDTLKGGAGNDDLDGGDGSDEYVVGAGDVSVDDFHDSGESGTDRIDATRISVLHLDATFSAAANGIEIILGATSGTWIVCDDAPVQWDFSALTLLDISAIKGTAEGDWIAGSSGADTVNGGAGNDTLAGNGGKDVLWGGKNTDTLAGNAGADALSGGGGYDLLSGGAGKDFLTGGKGADVFVFDTALDVARADIITDFNPGIDLLQLDPGIFTALMTTPGNALDAGEFQSGIDNIAQDADVRIIYNMATGALYYDADGNGDGAAIKIAVLEGAPALTEDDFIIVS